MRGTADNLVNQTPNSSFKVDKQKCVRRVYVLQFVVLPLRSNKIVVPTINKNYLVVAPKPSNKDDLSS